MKKILAMALFMSSSLIAVTASASGDIVAGKALVEKYSCAACHGADFKTPIDPTYPKLAGQHVDYLEHALTGYKRGNAANGRVNAIMSVQVKPLSGKDVKDIAAYLHSLPGTLVVRR